MNEITAPTLQMMVLARKDNLEAMRVAAGLTIFGHEVTLIFAGEALNDSDYQSEQAELLDLADIEPVTTLPAMQEHLRVVDQKELCALMLKADTVLNV